MRNELISVWDGKKRKGAYVPFHSHQYHELVYYIDGKGETTLGECVHAFSSHSLAVIPPGVFHDERHEQDGELICLIFHSEEIWKSGVRRLADDKILALLRGLLSETREQREGYEDMIRAYLDELCILLRRETGKNTRKKDLAYVIHYIKENCHEKLSLKECASYLNLGYDHFQHKFKAVTGLSPRQYLLSCRLSLAASLLQSTELSCTEIAYRAGFSTSAQMSSLFKREYGVTPLSHRTQKTGIAHPGASENDPQAKKDEKSENALKNTVKG